MQLFLQNISGIIWIRSSKFHNELKEADIVPAYQKKLKQSKESYRPKVSEKCLYDQMSNYFEDIFLKYQCGFRKGYTGQHSL